MMFSEELKLYKYVFLSIKKNCYLRLTRGPLSSIPVLQSMQPLTF